MDLGFDAFGRHLRAGKEVLGAFQRDGGYHWMNVTKITPADKLRIKRGGFRRVIQSSYFWDSIVGNTRGPRSFLELLFLF